MPRRLSRIFPLLVLAIHTLVIVICAAMAWQHKHDPFATVFYLPLVIADLPWVFIVDAAAPTVAGVVETMIGDADAAENVLAPGLGLAILGPIHWILFAWVAGLWMDRQRARLAARQTDSGRNSPPRITSTHQLHPAK